MSNCEPTSLPPDVEDGDNPEDITAAAEGMVFLENAPLPLVVALPDGRVALANRALRELLGYEAGDLVGRPLFEFVADAASAETWWQDLLAIGGTGERILRLRRRDGGFIRTRGAAIVVSDNRGATRWVIGRVQPV